MSQSVVDCVQHMTVTVDLLVSHGGPTRVSVCG